ncbi:hypothetical protein SAMN05216188_1435 [Lentzea xinjiangensis]|uniref:Secreted protein n=1 Tax=Lentzea xinjiangensis TaxID=402600 RepID=A0A1H9WTR4_9PSEU|nr:hypothetical protein [Lentzea xinjiangensis]SES37224.1 hypothetical protein SAMN05216188_1435 [Lentzea xinjiangensis]
MRKIVKAAIAAVFACGVALVPGGVASAETADADAICIMQVDAPAWGAGVLHLRKCNAFRHIAWNADGSREEIFAVRVDGTVWHTWPGNNGWSLMPGNKTADDMINPPFDGPDPEGRDSVWWSGSTRNLSVWAPGGTGYWCTSDPGAGWTGVWRDC